MPDVPSITVAGCSAAKHDKQQRRFSPPKSAMFLASLFPVDVQPVNQFERGNIDAP